MGLMDLAGDLVNGASGAFDAVADKAGDLYDDAAVSVNETASAIGETVGAIGGGIYDTAGGYYDTAKEVVAAHPEVIGGPVGDSPVAREYIGGLIDDLGGMYDDVVDKVDEMTSTSGMGSDVDALMEKSPTLAGNMEKLSSEGWTTVYGDEGTVCDSVNKRIIIHPREKGNTEGLVQSLAHESGHALYEKDPAVEMEGLTREEFVQRNLMRDLKNEGEATIMNMEVRNEILAATRNADGAGGSDIGIAGVGGAKYEAIMRRYPDPKDRDKMREEIAKEYAVGEHTGNSGETYQDYYQKQYQKQWDEAHAP